MQCKCKKGHASEFDGVCRYCRANRFRRDQLRKVGASYNDGLTLDDFQRLPDYDKSVYLKSYGPANR